MIALLQCLKIQRSDMRSMTSSYGVIGKSNYWVADWPSEVDILTARYSPQYSSSKWPLPKNSALTKIKEHHEHKNAASMAAQTNSVVMTPSEHGWVLCVFICTASLLTIYFQWPALLHSLFHEYHFPIYWFIFQSASFLYLVTSFLHKWVLCSKLDNQCHHALLAWIYHVRILLLSQIEIGT